MSAARPRTAGDGIEGERLVRIDELRRCLGTAFERIGLAPDAADELAGLLVDSELRGHADHGVAALATLVALYRDGRLNPRPDVRVVSETEGALVLDGDGGCGPAAPMRVMRWCIDRARERRGVAAGAVRNWQLLVAGPYARLAAEAGLIGFACTNFVPLVAPPGARTAVFGTNPLAYAIPAGRHPSVVLDVATTVSAMQKVRLAAEKREPLPEGIIFDGEGRPATDPAALLEHGGLMAPLGEPHAPHKGFGLALLVDALAGVLSGGAFARGVADGAPGNFLWALDVEAFLRREEFCRAHGFADRPGQAIRAAPRRRRSLLPRRAGAAPTPALERPTRRSSYQRELATPGADVRFARCVVAASGGQLTQQILLR
jgi:LDH2 family malate/lactate/ureidoglycolate dehydrogenase